METKLSILFYSKTSKTLADGRVPIYLRVTINGSRFEQSTQRYIMPDKWSVDPGRAKGNTEEARTMNHFLDTLRQKVYDDQQKIIAADLVFNLENFRNQWLGIKGNVHTLLEVFKHHNDQMFQLIGTDCSKATHVKYNTTYDHTAAFLQWKHQRPDIPITKLSYSFITDFEFYLKSKAKCNCVNKHLPPESGNHEMLNHELTRLLRIVEDLVIYAIKNNKPNKGAFVKETFNRSLDITSLETQIQEINRRAIKDKQNQSDIFFQFDDYILSKQRKVSKATLTVYRNVKSHLQAFEIYRKRKISFTCLDFSFYEDFLDYLTFEHVHLRRQIRLTGLKVNTIGKTIKHLCGFIKDRVKRKIIPPLDLSDFKIPEEESDAIYLTYAEIARIYQTDLSSQQYLIEYRDLFVLGCLTGLRFSDFSTLKPEDLQRDMLYKKQEKSDHWVIIPLREEAKLIFTRQFQEKIITLTNSEFNRHIKTIGKLAGIDILVKFSYKKGNRNIVVSKPKYDWITSHTARRSFCTNEFMAGTPVELIMKISGHKRTKDFYKYIRISPEEAANKIKDLWLKRNDMKLMTESSVNSESKNEENYFH